MEDECESTFYIPIRNTLYCPMLGTGLSCGEIEFEVCLDCPDREID